ncbi:hypothetical protein [Paenarthrobacter aurescens]|nr:hypothetical protein [Paenarthrobacter aurescens]
MVLRKAIVLPTDDHPKVAAHENVAATRISEQFSSIFAESGFEAGFVPKTSTQSPPLTT